MAHKICAKVPLHLKFDLKGIRSFIDENFIGKVIKIKFFEQNLCYASLNSFLNGRPFGVIMAIRFQLKW